MNRRSFLTTCSAALAACLIPFRKSEGKEKARVVVPEKPRVCRWTGRGDINDFRDARNWEGHRAPRTGDNCVFP